MAAIAHHQLQGHPGCVPGGTFQSSVLEDGARVEGGGLLGPRERLGPHAEGTPETRRGCPEISAFHEAACVRGLGAMGTAGGALGEVASRGGQDTRARPSQELAKPG